MLGEFTDELDLKLDDDELLALSRKWTANYQSYESKVKPRQEKNKAYYLGRQGAGSPTVSDDSISANLIFEAEETFLPAALAKNPEPVVFCDNTPEGNKIATAVKTMLQYHADTLVLRRKLTLMTRKWTIDMLGVVKHGWDSDIDDIKLEVRDAKNFIFDVEGYVDSYGDFVGALGERIKVTAKTLMDLYPKHREYVSLVANGMLGTEVTYTQWWNDDYTFTTFKGRVLEKSKNPFFNYPKEVPRLDSLGQPTQDESGQEVMEESKGNNHFGKPKKPYTFLAVFTFGDEPFDVTGLIEQNIPNQRRVSRRTDQIDYNLSRQNNSMVFSENNFTQETAKQASSGMAKGHPILVPSGGPIAEAIHAFPAEGITDSFFKELENSKDDLRSIFGTNGITSSAQDESKTVRGMILNNQYDNTRIGGGIGDALEQVADNIFNYQVQLYHVFYDDRHFAAIMGKMKAVEYVELSSSDLNRRIVVSVSPDSMKPKDEVSEMNQAISFFEMGAIGPKTLLTIANFPDPDDAAADGILYKTNPQLYMQLNFPELAQQLQQAAMQSMQAQGAAGAPPSGPPQGPQPQTAPPDQSLSVQPAGASLSSVPIPK